MKDLLKDQLLKRSVGCAQRAIRHYLNEEYEQFLIQAATSFEQLGKAKLARLIESYSVRREMPEIIASSETET